MKIGQEGERKRKRAAFVRFVHSAGMCVCVEERRMLGNFQEGMNE